MNIELLREVQKKIVENPERFDMRSFHSLCGTEHCIGGWAEYLKYGSTTGGERAATEALELTTDQAERLFYRGDYETCDDAERAKIASDRIDHFIATGGAE